MRLLLIAPLPNALTEYSALAASAGGARATRIASVAVATVAALAPSDFDVRLCDEAIESVDFDADVDVVGISTNVSQALRAIEIASAFRARGKIVVMGGPHVSLAPDLFTGHADCLVVGEFEPIAEEVFADMRRGALRARYDGAKADLRLAPPPRWELYPNEKAIGGVVQTSRGCPFECQFCDVIAYLGRVQRHKDDAQVVAEIQRLYDHGYDFIALADDNFTVYRRRAKSLLERIAAWNGAEGRNYIQFATQMSIDVARDDELLALCHRAGLLNAFIGIETDNAENLRDSRKRQNLGVDLGRQIEKVVRRGLQVEAALMVGFDHDDCGAFERQFAFAMRLPVCVFNISVLVAPVATPLYAEMHAQGRLVSDQVLSQFPSANLITNMIPAQMSRDDLYIGAKWLISKIMDPVNFIARMEKMIELLAPPPWETPGAAPRRVRDRRAGATTLFSRTLREMTRRDPAIAHAARRIFALIRECPELRDGITDAFSHYLMTLRGYEINGVYDRALAEAASPPFGQPISSAA